MDNTEISARRPDESDSQYAFRRMFSAIIHLELEPGSVLSESDLMKWLDLGRTPVREAIVRLRDCRLADVYPKKKSYVSKIDFRYVEEGALIRESVEERVFREIVLNIPVPFIAKLSENMEKQRQAVAEEDHKAFWNLDREFHKLFYEAAGRPWSWEIVSQATTHLDRVRYLMLVLGMASDEDTYKGHLDMYNRIMTRRMPESKDYLYEQITMCYRLKLPDLVKARPQYFRRDPDGTEGSESA